MRKIKQFLACILAAAMIIQPLPVNAASYSSYETEDLSIKFDVSSDWGSAYNAQITLKNTSDITIEDWYIKMPLDNKIVNIWNASIVEQTDDYYVIKNVGYNSDIYANSEVSFGFQTEDSFTSFPEYYERIGKDLVEIPEELYNVEYLVNESWPGGFNGNIKILNNQDEPIEDWVLEFDYEGQINNIWNGKISSHSGNHYVVKNADYNANIVDNISFGFGGNDKNINGNGDYTSLLSNVHLKGYGIKTYHNFVLTQTVEPTCTEEGYSVYECTTCDEIVKQDYVPALGHDYKKTIVEPTCTEEGYTEYVCSKCGDNFVDDITEKVDHVYDKETLTVDKESTCVEPGQKSAKCEVCGKIIESTIEELPLAEHTPGNPVKENENTEENTYDEVIYCSVCGEELSRTTKEDHNFVIKGSVDVASTSNGSYKFVRNGTTWTSNNQGKHSSTASTTWTIKALKDNTNFKINYGVSSEARYDTLSITLDGTKIVNSISGTVNSSYAKVLSKGNHTLTATYYKDVSGNSGSDKGYVTFTDIVDKNQHICEDCGVVENHNFVETVVEPTCTSVGSKTYTCEKCGYSYSSSIAKLPHNYEDVTTEPTCTQKGVTVHTCKDCGYSYRTEIAIIPHDYEVEVIEPTCTENGKNVYNCKNCDYSYETEGAAKLGHSFKDGICERCGITTFSLGVLLDENNEIICTLEEAGIDLNQTGMYNTKSLSYNIKNYPNAVTIVIPENITTIKSDMLSHESKTLRNVILPATLEKIEGYALGKVSNLDSVTILGENPNFKMENGALLSKDGTVLYLGLEGSSIPESVTTIAPYAFYYSNDVNLEIPSNVKNIGEYAFYSAATKNITIPDTVEKIGYHAFYNVERIYYYGDLQYPSDDRYWGAINMNDSFTLTSSNVDLVNPVGDVVLSTVEVDGQTYTITGIDYGAFRDCKELTSIYIPDTVDYISSYVFKNCTSLSKIYLDFNDINSKTISYAAFRNTGRAMPMVSQRSSIESDKDADYATVIYVRNSATRSLLYGGSGYTKISNYGSNYYTTYMDRFEKYTDTSFSFTHFIYKTFVSKNFNW